MTAAACGGSEARAPRWAAALAVAAALAAGCGDRPTPGAEPASPADRQEVQAMLEQFLPTLARAYASGDMEPMRPFAAQRVLAYTEKRVADLAARGMVLQPKLEAVVVEDLRTWGNDFGVVKTLETWDLAYQSTGGGVVDDRPDVKSRVAYQVKKEGGRWRVYHREMKQELSP